MNGSADRADSFSHAYQPQAGSFVTHVKADSIVDDQQQDSLMSGRELYLHVPGVAVRDDVMQCFLGDTI